jgi:serine/threonine protein kinase
MGDTGRRSASGLTPVPRRPEGTTPLEGPYRQASTGPMSTPRPPMLPDDSGLQGGTMLGKYQIVRRLGSGGMGSVYEAIHTGIGKPVALKTLAARLASEDRAQARFLREAASASRLDHPHVVDVIDFGSEAGITYLVMELLRGEDLGSALIRESGGLTVESTADIMLAVCAGVFAAHEAGVVHRDLKPQNIFLAQTAIGDVVPKVLDFGISKLLDDQMSQNLTGTGTVMGTTPYLSPEQVAGHAVDARSDQYTLGVILYECATGRRPHDGESLFLIMRSIADGRFLRPTEVQPDIPAAFEAVILRCMSFPPDRRFESVYALGQALLPFASAKRQLMWSDYFSMDRGPSHTAPLPAGGAAFPERLATPSRPRGRTPLPLPSTGVHPSLSPAHSGTQFGYSVAQPVYQEPRRTPWAVIIPILLVVLGGGGFWAYRSFLAAPADVDPPVERTARDPIPEKLDFPSRPGREAAPPALPPEHAVAPAQDPPAADDPSAGVWPDRKPPRPAALDDGTSLGRPSAPVPQHRTNSYRYQRPPRPSRLRSQPNPASAPPAPAGAPILD